jgi:membrane-associated phospholipid phosphatase
MPSGHAEFTTLFCSLLYLNNIIPLWMCLLFITIVSLQRVLLYRHTSVQVLVGIILGFFYASLYNYFNVSIIGFIIVLFIGFVLSLFILHKIHN